MICTRLRYVYCLLHAYMLLCTGKSKAFLSERESTNKNQSPDMYVNVWPSLINNDL